MLTDAQEAFLYRLIGRRIAELRRDRFTQEQLADLVRLSRTSIANLEAGRQRAPFHHFVAIAQALGVDVREMIPSPQDLSLDSRTQDPTEALDIVGELTPAARQLLLRVLRTAREPAT